MGLKSIDALLLYTDSQRHANAPAEQLAQQVTVKFNAASR